MEFQLEWRSIRRELEENQLRQCETAGMTTILGSFQGGILEPEIKGAILGIWREKWRVNMIALCSARYRHTTPPASQQRI